MAFNKTQMMITKETIYHNEQQQKKVWRNITTKTKLFD
jgi:hypothetical protein